MCSPSLIFLGIAAGGELVKATGQVLTGLQKKSAGKLQQKLLNQSAKLERGKAMLNEERVRRRNRRLLGDQVVGFASSGVRIDVGTPLDVMAESVADGELDALTVRAGGQIKARDLTIQGEFARKEGNQAFVSSLFGAGSTILGAGGKIAGAVLGSFGGES